MNIERLAEQSGLDPEDIEVIARVFETSIQETINRLRGAHSSGDREAMIAALHKMAGSSAAVLGLGRINELARAGEDALGKQQPLDVDALCEQVETILKEAGF